MASTSASSVQKTFKYDVFLSFRGEDVRKTFIDHLYLALHQKSIITYKDDERIEKGERISEQLIRSIEDSRFYIIVFSKNYASSSWCLDELVKIMECQKMAEHTAYPIFFDVEPTEVRQQIGAVGEAFAKAVGKGKRKRTEEDADVEEKEKEAAGRWKDALKEAAGLAGWELKNTLDGHEAKFIQQIVQEISLRLHFVNSSVDAKLVGMEMRVKNVVSSLETGSDDVRMIGIKGIGGGGKTTLARAVFDLMCVWFEGKSFVENVREVSKGSGLKKLQKQVLKDVLNDKSVDVTSVSDGKDKMKRRMCGVKALVVLDDVDDIDQLEALAGELTWFKPGSRIIITTRDRQVLVAHGVNAIHDVNLLSHEEALCLFSRHAFKKEIPNPGYEELASKVVDYAAGLPLTLKVLGSHLCTGTEPQWVDAIERLKTIPLEKTLTRLEISYDSLENDQKEIFLDVACLLKGMEREIAIRVLESRGFNAEIGLRVLEQKSLLTVSDAKCLQMHDHLEEMGKYIVCRLHPGEPNKHNRLWYRKEIDDILVNDLGTNGTKSIKLHHSKLPPDIIMKGLRKMKELRVLCVYDYPIHIPASLIHIPADPVDQYLPNTLQSLYWVGYPFTCLPKTFQANNLVHLEISYGKITQLWEGGEKKVLNKLKFLVLKNLDIRNFDMGMTPNLQICSLEGCNKLVELSMSFGCPKLELLDLHGSKVSSLNIVSAPCLETLDLENCNNLVELHIPVECPKLEHLDLCGTKVSSLNIGSAPCLKTLNLAYCNDLVELHIPVDFPKLELLDLCGSKVSSLNIGSAPCLEKLDLENCKELVELHIPGECPRLKLLDLFCSKVSSLNIGSAPCLEMLILADCNDLVELHTLVELPKLKFLDLSCSKVSSVNLDMTPHLERLDLKNCYFLQNIHNSIRCLKKLEYFDLSGCSRFEYFGGAKGYKLTGLESVATRLNLTVESLHTCPLYPDSNLLSSSTILELFSASICGLQRVRELTLEGGIPEVPKDLYLLESLEHLTLSMKEITHLPDSICMLKHLKYLKLRCCPLLEQLPNDLDRLEGLEELHLTDCMSLREIPNSICNMKSLHYLDLRFCILVEKLPEEIGRLESLEQINIEGAGIRRLPQSIFQLKGLYIIGSMWRLKSYGFTTFRELSPYPVCCNSNFKHQSLVIL